MAEAQFWIGVHGVIAEGGRILVLRRAARMAYRPGHWDLPGGHLSLNETIEECLHREVAEETGLEVEILRMLGLNQASDGPYVQVIYACRPVGENRAIRLRENEHAEARWVEPGVLSRYDALIPYLSAVLRRGMIDYLSAGNT
jgi:8-oxo-dGTP diphosphatase